ncbi:MAG TPA: VOC family protein [Longimicrobiales bacterium]|nr:VOC family protein [Longimicrobiales bacterium]
MKRPVQPESRVARRSIAQVALVVRDYDEAIEFFTKVLDFVLLEDLYVAAQDKRWVRVGPRGAHETSLVLARASNPEQELFIGNQTGGRVAFFLRTDDFWRDFRAFQERGVEFVREPREEEHGTVAVFKDLYGNLWDLVAPRRAGQS